MRTVLAPGEMVGKKKKRSQNVPFCRGAGRRTLAIECARSVLAQDCAEARALKEGFMSVKTTLPLVGKIKVLPKTLFMIPGPNYKYNLCIRNPLEISIKFDICASLS